VTSTEARYLLRASRAAGEELGSSFSMTDGHHHIDLRVIGFCRVRLLSRKPQCRGSSRRCYSGQALKIRIPVSYFLKCRLRVW